MITVMAWKSPLNNILDEFYQRVFLQNKIFYVKQSFHSTKKMYVEVNLMQPEGSFKCTPLSAWSGLNIPDFIYPTFLCIPHTIQILFYILWNHTLESKKVALII